MTFDYEYTLSLEGNKPLDDFATLLRIWMGVAEIATKGSRKDWTLKTHSTTIEFAFKKRRQRDRFGEHVDDLLTGSRNERQEALALLR